MAASRSSKGHAKLKIVIDCDAGIDDAQAIMIALSQEVDLLGITCTYGNVDVDQVTKNVLKVLEVCGRTDIPVYKGAHRPVLGKTLEYKIIASRLSSFPPLNVILKNLLSPPHLPHPHLSITPILYPLG